MYVVNLEMDNSLKWLIFNIVGAQLACDALWTSGEVFFIENLTVSFIPKNGRKYSHKNS